MGLGDWFRSLLSGGSVVGDRSRLAWRKVADAASGGSDALRTTAFTELESLGFRPAHSLPNPEIEQPLRPAKEIAARLMALQVLFAWVSLPEKTAGSIGLKSYIDRNGLQDWLAQEEAAIVGMRRTAAHSTHVDTIGWRLENIWALAWVLGFDPEPDLEASQVGDKITGPIFKTFLPSFNGSIEDLLARASPRSATIVIAMEYWFYCAHNAVRSAQLGGDTVPKGFHPVIHGGAIHERRHSLSWCLAPNVPWDDTDLST